MPENEKGTETKEFSDDIYSTSDLNKKIVFSADEVDCLAEDDEAGGSIDMADPAAAVDFTSMGERNPRISPSLTSQTPKRKSPLNGITWENRRKKERRGARTLNNGEPVAFALRKMIKECLIIFVCVALAVCFFFGREFISDALTDNAYETLSMSNRYKAPISLPAPTAAQVANSDGYSCIQAMEAWAGVSASGTAMMRENDGKDKTASSDGMLAELERALPNHVVTVKSSLKNYTLLTQIYDSLKTGSPVIIACLNRKADGRGYAIVTAMDTQNATVSLMWPDGKEQTLSHDQLIALTRFSGYKNESLLSHLGFAFGYYTKNTAFFITEKGT